MSVEEGKKAPDFTAATDGGGKLKLSDLRGKPVVLYFYPKDDTPGCTTEACGFRDSAAAFKKLKAQVVGVSKDSVARHDKFKAKYELPFFVEFFEIKTPSNACCRWSPPYCRAACP